jgi:hypothetical protein
MVHSFGKKHSKINYSLQYIRSVNKNMTWGIIEAVPSTQQIQTIIFSTVDDELDISKVIFYMSLHFIK